jgi:Tfp pilus assembly protein PilV
MKNQRDGFTMMEIVIGMVILMFLVLTTNAYMLSFIKTNTSVREISKATYIGNTGMEKLKAKPISSLVNGADTIDNKYCRSWNVFPNYNSNNMSKIVLSVDWPLAVSAGPKHHIQLSTIIAQ